MDWDAQITQNNTGLVVKYLLLHITPQHLPRSIQVCSNCMREFLLGVSQHMALYLLYYRKPDMLEM